MVEVYLVMPDLSRSKVEALVRLSGELRVSILVSYSTFKLKPATLRGLEELRGRAEVNVMLDSGAYHVARLGLNVSVEEYARFAERHQRLFNIVVAPDVPGDAEATVERTREFSRVYRGWFLPVLQGTRLEEYLWCARELREIVSGGGYVGVGGLDGSKRRVEWLGKLLSKLCGSVELHLFGLGARLTKTLTARYGGCVKSVDTGAWSSEIAYRRRSTLGAGGDIVELEYKAMKSYLERFSSARARAENLARYLQGGGVP